jgi:hypothetical protein
MKARIVTVTITALLALVSLACLFLCAFGYIVPVCYGTHAMFHLLCFLFYYTVAWFTLTDAPEC